AMTAESSSKAGRGLAMALYVNGYPVGGVVGGVAAQGWLLVEYDWRAEFLFGAIVIAVMFALAILQMLATRAFYAARRSADALEKINKSLRALRQPPIDALPEIEASAPKPKVTEILSNPRLRPVTLLLAFGYLFHTLTFYYILKFAPTIVAGAGFTQPEAASSLTYANIGGALGGFLFGFLLRKWDIKGPTVAVAVLGSFAVAAFGIGSDTLWGWRIAAFLTMFFLNAAIVGY